MTDVPSAGWRSVYRWAGAELPAYGFLEEAADRAE